MYLDDDLDRELRHVAASEARSAAAVVRKAVRRYIAAGSSGISYDPIRAAVGRFTGGPPDSARRHDRYIYGEERACRPSAMKLGSAGGDD